MKIVREAREVGPKSVTTGLAPRARRPVWPVEQREDRRRDRYQPILRRPASADFLGRSGRQPTRGSITL